MKTREQYEAFIADVKELCAAHDIGMVGTCSGESIYGEITLFEASDPLANVDSPSDWRERKQAKCGWLDLKENKFNFDYKPDQVTS